MYIYIYVYGCVYTYIYIYIVSHASRTVGKGLTCVIT